MGADFDGGTGGDIFEIVARPAFYYYLALYPGHFFVMQSMRSQIIGKMLLPIRVAAWEGDLTPRRVAVRTVLRLVDGLAYGIVAIVTILFSPRHQRLGDMAARKAVIRA